MKILHNKIFIVICLLYNKYFIIFNVIILIVIILIVTFIPNRLVLVKKRNFQPLLSFYNFNYFFIF